MILVSINNSTIFYLYNYLFIYLSIYLFISKFKLSP